MRLLKLTKIHTRENQARDGTLYANEPREEKIVEISLVGVVVLVHHLADQSLLSRLAPKSLQICCLYLYFREHSPDPLQRRTSVSRSHSS